jgi:hypothetical protein
MEIYNLTRPSVLLPAACAPSALSAAAAAPVATPVMAAAWAPVPRVHQVQTQAELALTSPVPTGGSTNGINGSTGSMGLGVSFDSKRYVDERGTPPRGRPV